MQQPYPTKVKRYKRRTGNQYIITITGKHEFEADQEVYILPRETYEELKQFEDDVKTLTSTHQTEQLKHEQQHLHDTETINQLNNNLAEKDAELLKVSGFIGMALAGVADLKQMGWWDRLTRKVPPSLEQLKRVRLPPDLDITPGDDED